LDRKWIPFDACRIFIGRLSTWYGETINNKVIIELFALAQYSEDTRTLCKALEEWHFLPLMTHPIGGSFREGL